jgi:hypothetical protein
MPGRCIFCQNKTKEIPMIQPYLGVLTHPFFGLIMALTVSAADRATTFKDDFDCGGIAGVSAERPAFWSLYTSAGAAVTETNGELVCLSKGALGLRSILYSDLDPAFDFFGTNLLLQVRGLEVEQDYAHSGNGLCNRLIFQFADADATDDFWLEANKLGIQLDSGTGTPSGAGQSLLQHARIYGRTLSGENFEAERTLSEKITGFDLIADGSGCRLTLFHGSTNTMLYIKHTFTSNGWNNSKGSSLSVFLEKFDSSAESNTLVQRIGSISAAPTSIAADPWAGRQVPKAASVCDHRCGADFSFTQNTDLSYTQSIFYAEACAFKFNLQGTVYDAPFDGNVTEMQRLAICGTGRLSFEIYLQTDRWHNPADPDGSFSLIPDYYSGTYSQAGVDAGFSVTVGQSKTTRFPNHGDQLYDISNGLYGYDTATDTAGQMDVLSDLIRYQKGWTEKISGLCPASASYRNGRSDAYYAISRHLLGARNSGSSAGDISYGSSSEGYPYCGKPDPFGPEETCNYPSTTRVGDMNAPKAEVIAHCTNLLEQAIHYRGWYRDFIHWHTNPRYELTLHDFYEAVRKHIGSRRAACVSAGEALQHRYLRDMANVTLTELKDGLLLEVAYTDPWQLPMECFNIPLSIRVWTGGTALAGRELISPDAVSLRKIDLNQFVVDVPFRRCEETIQVHLYPADRPNYLNESLPVIETVSVTGAVWQICTDQPTRLALFSWPENLGLGDLRPTNRVHRVDIVSRSSETALVHTLDLTQSLGALSGRSIYIGAITEERQSILKGPFHSDGSLAGVSEHGLLK